MFLNEEFLKLYEELTQLNEANEDRQKFINKFGKDVFDTFWNKKQLLRNKGINVDITYHVAHTSKEAMQKILDSVSDANRATTLDVEGKLIPKNTGNFEIVYDGPHYTVYNPKDYIASIHCAHGGRWCTAGGYNLPDGQVKVSQAQQYFNQYTGGSTVLYYFIGKYGSGDDRYALAHDKDDGTGHFFDYYDNEISRDEIPYIDEVEITGVDLEDLWSGQVCDDCGDQVEDGYEYYGPNGECYCEYCFMQNYFFCAECGEATDQDEECTNPNGESICERCFEQDGYVLCKECDTVYDVENVMEDFVGEGNFYCDDCWYEYLATDKYGMVEAVILMVENNELFTEVDSLATAKMYLDNWYKYKDECLPKSRYAIHPDGMKKISDTYADHFTSLVHEAGLT